MILVDDIQPCPVMEEVKKPFFLVILQQSGVDKHAGQPVTQRACRKQGGHVGIQAAGHQADGVAVACSLSDVLSCLAYKRLFVPPGSTSADGERKIGQQARAFGVMCLKLQLQAETALVADGKPDRCPFRTDGCDHLCILRETHRNQAAEQTGFGFYPVQQRAFGISDFGQPGKRRENAIASAKCRVECRCCGTESKNGPLKGKQFRLDCQLRGV